jgi:hypothetical protein
MTASEPASGVKPAHSVSLPSLLLNFARQFWAGRDSVRDIKNFPVRCWFGLMRFVLVILNSRHIVDVPRVFYFIQSLVLIRRG